MVEQHFEIHHMAGAKTIREKLLNQGSMHMEEYLLRSIEIVSCYHEV